MKVCIPCRVSAVQLLSLRLGQPLCFPPATGSCGGWFCFLSVKPQRGHYYIVFAPPPPFLASIFFVGFVFCALAILPRSLALPYRPDGGKGGEGANKASLYFRKAHSKSEAVRQPTSLKGGTLKEYQLQGLQWMVRRALVPVVSCVVLLL